MGAGAGPGREVLENPTCVDAMLVAWPARNVVRDAIVLGVDAAEAPKVPQDATGVERRWWQGCQKWGKEMNNIGPSAEYNGRKKLQEKFKSN